MIAIKQTIHFCNIASIHAIYIKVANMNISTIADFVGLFLKGLRVFLFLELGLGSPIIMSDMFYKFIPEHPDHVFNISLYIALVSNAVLCCWLAVAFRHICSVAKSFRVGLHQPHLFAKIFLLALTVTYVSSLISLVIISH